MGGADEKESQIADLTSRAANSGKEMFELVNETGARLEKTMELRREFFEKLVILDGGTIALSVSLLGNLGSHHAPQLIRLLGTSWILLMLGMAFGMSRNWFFYEERNAAIHLWIASALERLTVPFTEMAAVTQNVELRQDLARAQSNGAVKLKLGEQKHARLEAVLSWCGRMCIASTLGGYGFLIWFALRNLSTFVALK